MAEDAHSHWANDSPLRLNPIGSLHRQGLPRTESWLSQSPHLDFPSYEERNLASHPPWARATFQAVGLGQGGRLPSLRSTFGTLSSGAAYSTLWSLPPASTSLETSNSDLDGALSGHVGPQASDAGSSSSTRAVTGAPSPDGVPLASGSPRRGHELPLHTSDSHGFIPPLVSDMIVRSRERTRAMRSSHMARRGRQPNPVDQASLPSPPRLTRYDLQMFHGHLRTRKVISKAGLRSLIHLDSDKLPKDERFCNICYVAFGESSPDGVTETPVKIPACSHVFGGNCLKTWLEESPCCPYCRHQLPSENRFLGPLKESVRDALMGHGIITTQDHPDNHMAIMARFLRHANEFDYDDDDADDDDEVPVFPRHNRRRRRSPDSDEDAPRTRPRLSVHGHDSQHRSMPGHSVPVASHTWRGHAPALERTMSDIYPPQGSRTPSTPRTIETIYGEAPSFFGMAMTPPMEAAGNMSPSVSASQRQHSGRGAGFVGAGPGDGLLSMTPGHTGSGLTQLAMVADLRLEPSYARTSSGANGRAASAASAPHHAAQGGSMGQGRPLPSQAVPDSMCPQGHAGSQSHRATRAGPRDSFLGEFLLPSPNGQAENTNNRRTTMDWPAQHEE